MADNNLQSIVPSSQDIIHRYKNCIKQTAAELLEQLKMAAGGPQNLIMHEERTPS